MNIRISVRNLVEFIMRSGDIDNRHSGKASEKAMQEGSRIHRMIQRRAGSAYEAEVPMKYSYVTERYTITIEGRADGVITTTTGVVIDEIKGTYRDLDKLEAPQPVHLAQAMCYAFFYCIQNKLDRISVRLTYCNLETEEIRYFEEEYSAEDITKWFDDLMSQYRKWADFEVDWREIRQSSVKALEFPFAYRDGQKELVTHVYHTICHKRKLFVEAPTGVGKTISTLFPAVKAVGEGKAQRIFYLTAKTITRTVAADTYDIMRQGGLRMKTVVITAKEKICPMDKTECNPKECPYAKGHFDRINDAMYELLTTEDSFTRDIITEYSEKYMVCPFEFCLDMSLFADGVICDYNYLFDPHVYLKRFFAEGSKGEHLFLIDEAHNLLERGREMYSAQIVKEDLLALKASIKAYTEDKIKIYPELEAIVRQLNSCNKEMLNLKRMCAGEYHVLTEHGILSSLVLRLNNLFGKIEKYLEDEEKDSDLRSQILEYYFELSHFLMIWEGVDEHYSVYLKFEGQDCFMCRLFCVNPSYHLRTCMDRGVSSVLFSATLLPIQYYKSLLGGQKEDYEVYAHSVFESDKRGLFIARDVTSRYKSRGMIMYKRIASYIKKIVDCKRGNYLVFFPSYAFAKAVYECFSADEKDEILIQAENMREDEREYFLQSFEENRNRERSLIAFCVMGGVFSEGIDLKGERLIGAIVVGNGMPQVCPERDILRQHFDHTEEKGFDYAYTYPGMNKVLQAAGRVIRTADDIGIVVLLEERFREASYQRLFPREWDEYKIVDIDTVSDEIKDFWSGHGML